MRCELEGLLLRTLAVSRLEAASHRTRGVTDIGASSAIGYLDRVIRLQQPEGRGPNLIIPLALATPAPLGDATKFHCVNPLNHWVGRSIFSFFFSALLQYLRVTVHHN